MKNFLAGKEEKYDHGGSERVKTKPQLDSRIEEYND